LVARDARDCLGALIAALRLLYTRSYDGGDMGLTAVSLHRRPSMTPGQPPVAFESESSSAASPLTQRSAPPTQGAIQAAVARARDRLERRLLTRPAVQYRRPPERPFTAEDRGRVTILISGLTTRHERLIQAALQAAGLRCQPLPVPDLESCLVGKQYGNNGLCNPAYFTVGNLVAALQRLEASGLSRQEIVDRYAFFTAGGCGPCRFGMYEAEFQLALRNAGFEGFRILTFQQGDGIKAQTGHSGFGFSLLLGLGALNAFQVADVLNDFGHTIRPFEATPGATDAALADVLEMVAGEFATRRSVELRDHLPSGLAGAAESHKVLATTVRVLFNLREHLWSRSLDALMARVRSRLASIELDRLRVKPVVKVTGEFWAQTTEGDGNYRMFEFLEREGAHVVADPLSAWVMYLLWQPRARLLYKRGLHVPRVGPVWKRWRARAADDLRVLQKRTLLDLGERIYRGRYDRLRRSLGGVPHPIVDMLELERLAEPYYLPLARGGEGHLEVAKNIYYSTGPAAHMVMSLKPFGCMPSTQSDGVQSAVVAHFKDMLFLPIETAAEGELNAHSRVQMALVEARARAQAEFDRALASTGRRMADIRRYVDAHPELRDPFHPVPRSEGVVGIAANFVLYVAELMDADRAWRGRRVAAASTMTPSPTQASS
jgi:predicted nucleotide-binding protein (sugar kinase/HSP70/actin superfamily)